MNTVILEGKVHSKVVFHYLETGELVGKFFLEVKRKNNQVEDVRKEADILLISLFREVAEQYHSKLNISDKVMIIGQLQVNTYDVEEWSDQTFSEVIAETLFLNGNLGDSLIS